MVDAGYDVPRLAFLPMDMVCGQQDRWCGQFTIEADQQPVDRTPALSVRTRSMPDAAKHAGWLRDQ
ncbi:hypothetical protein AB0H86_07895 [Streptomyces sp. NPDC050997]|uniref:hypothetical protein n=1 Tax=Streptomyces sp. NPDC050997 TaxID=3155519 RepID=UPI003425CDF5